MLHPDRRQAEREGSAKPPPRLRPLPLWASAAPVARGQLALHPLAVAQ
jgi:hypothetical protein